MFIKMEQNLAVEAIIYGSSKCPHCKELREDLDNITKKPEKYIRRYAEKVDELKEKINNLTLREIKVVYYDMLNEFGLAASGTDGKINPSRIPVLVIKHNGEEVFRRDSKYKTVNAVDTVIPPQDYIKYLVKNGN